MSEEEEEEEEGEEEVGASDGDPEEPPIVPTTEEGWLSAPPPGFIADLATACIRFVERAVGVKLDFTPETLPLLDHYLESARGTFSTSDPKEESLELVSQAAGAYLGEVIRRRYAGWWRLGAGASPDHRLELHRLHLVIHPVHLVLDALTLDPNKPGAGSALGGFDLDPADAQLVSSRLADLPPVELDEFVKPSTRLEVLDIVVDAVRAADEAREAEPLALAPRDYVH